MKKYIGIFAHPDDEAFGPGGSFIHWKDSGAETFVLTATKGELGGEDGVEKQRLKEMEASAAALGLTGHYFLGFKDGELSNKLYQSIADAAVKKLSECINEGDDVTLVTFDRNGLSGHLDHIAMSMITTHIYAHREQWLPKMSSCDLLYYCLPASSRPKADINYFVFAPAGRDNDEIDMINDVSSVLERKKQAIRAHASQHADEFLQRFSDEHLSREYFSRCRDV